MLAGAALAVMILTATLALLTVAAYFSGQSKEAERPLELEQRFPNLSLQVWRQEEEQGDRLAVDLYYEVLCPDSRSFFLYQLYPAWEVLKNIFSVNLIPYGKAYTSAGSERYQFSCQHGPLECQANIFHACAIHHVPAPQDRMDFIRCMIYDNYDPPGAVRRCAREVTVDLPAIEACAAGDEGNLLHKLAGDLTHNLQPRMTFVPTIEVDGRQHHQRSLRRYFARQLCNLYSGTKPLYCDVVTL